MIEQEGLLNLITEIHDAGLDSSKWESVLYSLRHTFKAECAHLDLLSPGSLNPVLSSPACAVCDTDKRGGPQACCEKLRSCDAHRVLAITVGEVAMATGIVRLHRTKDEATFSAHEHRSMQLLSPHFRSAFRVHMRLRETALSILATDTTLSMLPFGTILINARSEILGMNAAAEKIVEARDGLSIALGKLEVGSPDRSRQLVQLIESVSGDQASANADGAMSVVRESGNRPYQLLIVPASRAATNGEDQVDHLTTTAVIYISDPEDETRLPERVLKEFYGLTCAEARVAASLVSGMELKAIATAHGTTCETVRSQLKQVFCKTETHSQAELVSALMSGVAVLGDRRSAGVAERAVSGHLPVQARNKAHLVSNGSRLALATRI